MATKCSKSPRKTSAAKRKAQQAASRQMKAVILFALGVVVTALAIIPGSNVWLWLHNLLLGLFSWMALPVGPFMLYLAVKLSMDQEKFPLAARAWCRPESGGGQPSAAAQVKEKAVGPPAGIRRGKAQEAAARILDGKAVHPQDLLSHMGGDCRALADRQLTQPAAVRIDVGLVDAAVDFIGQKDGVHSVELRQSHPPRRVMLADFLRHIGEGGAGAVGILQIQGRGPVGLHARGDDQEGAHGEDAEQRDCKEKIDRVGLYASASHEPFPPLSREITDTSGIRLEPMIS